MISSSGSNRLRVEEPPDLLAAAEVFLLLGAESPPCVCWCLSAHIGGVETHADRHRQTQVQGQKRGHGVVVEGGRAVKRAGTTARGVSSTPGPSRSAAERALLQSNRCPQHCLAARTA